MKSALRIVALGMLLLVPFAAYAQAPSVSAISDVTLNAGATVHVNVVAVSLVNDAITLTSSLPGFCTLNSPTTGTGLVVTTLTLAPMASDVGTYAASVTATAGSLTDVETFQITVNAAGSNVAPVVVAPATRTGTEGSNISFMVTATDADDDAITSFAAAGLPVGATFTPNGSNTSGAFSWTPSLTQAGDYDVVFTASNALSGAATTHIHVNEAIAGGNATVRILGQFKTTKETTCFRVESTSFDVRNVDLTSIHLVFNGLSIAPLSGRTKIDTECGDDDGDNEGDCDDGADCGNCNRVGDDGHEGDCDHEDGCGDCATCEHDTTDCATCDQDTTGCEATLHACFSTHDIVTLFGDAGLPGAFANATVEGTLTTGGAFVATFDASKLVNHWHGDDNGHHGLKLKVSPNPLNPKTKLTFTLSQPGRVRVAVYDLQGRLVSKLLDENRGVGEQSLSWDGSNSRSERVASGVYFFRIQAPQGQEVQRVAVLK